MKITKRKQMTIKYIPSRYYIEQGKYKFSLIRLPDDYKKFEKNLWEIYQVGGRPTLTMWEDVERFRTKKEAIKRIKYLVRISLWIRLKRLLRYEK